MGRVDFFRSCSRFLGPFPFLVPRSTKRGSNHSTFLHKQSGVRELGVGGALGRAHTVVWRGGMWLACTKLGPQETIQKNMGPSGAATTPPFALSCLRASAGVPPFSQPRSSHLITKAWSRGHVVVSK